MSTKKGSELLVYPSPTQKTSEAKGCARVLLSAAMSEEKTYKKGTRRERTEDKQELKKLLRKKKRKAQERQAKQAEKQKKAEQQRATGQEETVHLMDPDLGGID